MTDSEPHAAPEAPRRMRRELWLLAGAVLLALIVGGFTLANRRTIARPTGTLIDPAHYNTRPTTPQTPPPN